MKKHDTYEKPELDGLLDKLEQRYRERERKGGVFPSEAEFQRRFFQAAKQSKRPHFPLIWKAAACTAVCLLAFQVILSSWRDDASAEKQIPAADTAVLSEDAAVAGAGFEPASAPDENGIILASADDFAMASEESVPALMDADLTESKAAVPAAPRMMARVQDNKAELPAPESETILQKSSAGGANPPKGRMMRGAAQKESNASESRREKQVSFAIAAQASDKVVSHPVVHSYRRPFLPPPVVMPPIRIMPPPRRPADPKYEAVNVVEASAKVRIRGELARTEFEAVVYNPNPSVLEGEFTFPLPAGASVTGVALDINGKMIDASIVEKKRAQEVFEAIERKGADPALVESVGGNMYRTRIYPIPAHGSRKIRIAFVSEVDRINGAPIFTLPMRFEQKLSKFALRVEVMDPAAAPQIESSPFANLNFTNWENALLAEQTLENIALPEDLRITVADKPAPVQIERFDGKNYFTISAPVGSVPSPAFQAPSNAAILWDASGSRAANDHGPELELLKQWFARPEFKNKTVAVSVSILRNSLEAPRSVSIVNGDASDLISLLKKTVYDGGTDLGGLAKFFAVVPDGAYALVFTDGIQSFGKEPEPPAAAKRNTAFISVSTTAETSYLEYLAETMGGNTQYLNLARMTPENAAQELSATGRTTLNSVKIDGVSAPDFLANAKQFKSGSMRIAGTFPDGKHTLEITLSGLPVQKFELNSKDAVEGKLLRTYYGLLKLEEMKRNPKTEQSDYLTLGQEYGIVTPGTSMLVLESLAQYLEYGIRPPESLADFRAKFDADAVEKAKAASKAKSDEKMNLDKRIAEVESRYRTEILDWYDGKIKVQPRPRLLGGRPAAADMDNGSVMRPSAVMDGGGKGMGGFGGAAGARPMPAQTERRTNSAGINRPMMEMEMADEEVAEDIMVGDPIAKKEKTAASGPSKAIKLNTWTSDAPYLKELAEAKDKAQEKYLELRGKNASNLGFFVDCADFFAEHGQKEFAVRVLSNLAEMQLENRMILRILAYKLKYFGNFDAAEAVFRKILKLSPEEPQSYRDLSLILAEKQDWQAAADMMMEVIVRKFDGRFNGVDLIAVTELNDIVGKAKRAGKNDLTGIDSRLIHPLEMDLRITIGWDTDMSDMDLHTFDPAGEECSYQRRLTSNGGRNSFDFTQGYGPEEFMVKNAINGDYNIKAHYFGQRAQKLIGPVTLYAEIVTDFGRPEEKHDTVMFRLAARDEMVNMGSVTMKGSKTKPGATAADPVKPNPPRPLPRDPVMPLDSGTPDVARMYQVRANESLEDIAESQLGDRARVQDLVRANEAKLRGGQAVTGTILTIPPR